jgi:hypothetical protein
MISLDVHRESPRLSGLRSVIGYERPLAYCGGTSAFRVNADMLSAGDVGG